jgi:hypothetical protein
MVVALGREFDRLAVRFFRFDKRALRCQLEGYTCEVRCVLAAIVDAKTSGFSWSS